MTFSRSLHVDCPVLFLGLMSPLWWWIWDCILIFCYQKEHHSEYPCASVFTCMCHRFCEKELGPPALCRRTPVRVLRGVSWSLLSPSGWKGSSVFPLFSRHWHFWHYRRPVVWISWYHILIFTVLNFKKVSKESIWAMALGQWCSTLANHWNHLERLFLYLCQGSIPRAWFISFQATCTF